MHSFKESLQVSPAMQASHWTQGQILGPQTAVETDLGSQCALLQLQGLVMDIQMVVEAGDGSQTDGLQLHSWRG